MDRDKRHQQSQGLIGAQQGLGQQGLQGQQGIQGHQVEVEILGNAIGIDHSIGPWHKNLKVLNFLEFIKG